MNKLISNIYFNAKHPAGFSSYNTLRKHVPKSISDREIKEFLQSQEAYTLHAPARKKFKRDVVYVTNIDENWHVDLADMQKFKRENDGASYILVAIDVLSKFAMVRVLKNKSAEVVKSALEDIISKTGRKPLTICVDKGLEFKNNIVKTFLKENDIGMYSTENADIKACVAERFIRTMKTKLWRYFTHSNSHRYVDILQDIIKGYNSTVHSSIGTAPDSVNEHNFLSAWKKLYQHQIPLAGPKPKLQVGDKVRISKTKKTFSKGYENNYSKEIFVVKNVLHRRPVMYEILDLQDEKIAGRFYESELQKVGLPDYHKIDKIIKTRGKGDSKELYVSWTGYPDKFNSWISANNLKK